MNILGAEVKAENEREENLAQMVSEKVKKCMEEDRGMPIFIISGDIKEISAYNQCMFALGMVDGEQHGMLDDRLLSLMTELHGARQSMTKMHPVLRQAIGQAVMLGEANYYVRQGEIPSATLKIIKNECYYRELDQWVNFLHPDYDMIIDPRIGEKVDLDDLPEKSRGRDMGVKEIKHSAYRQP